MSQQEIVLQANLCNSCGGVWFTPNFKHEGEQGTCPYCKVVLRMAGQPTDISEGADTDTVPSEIVSIMDSKTKEVLIEKKCNFCSNFILVANSDVETSKFCPYCGDNIVRIPLNDQQGNQNQSTEMGDETSLDSLNITPVVFLFKVPDSWYNRLFKVKPKSIYGICLGCCVMTQMVKILVQPELEIKWFQLADIEVIEEIMIPDDIPISGSTYESVQPV